MAETIVVQDLDIPTRADKFLSSGYESISRTQIKKLFDNGQVLCNGTIIPPKYRVRNGDVLSFELPEIRNTTMTAHGMSLDILFEDEHIIVINKPPGIVVHPGSGTVDPTLVQGVLAHCKLSTIGGDTRPGVVHRLDKDTTGVIIFAKTNDAHLKLVKMFAEHRIKKRYLAIVCGTFALHSGTIDKPIGRHRTIRVKMDVQPGGRPALTDWTVLESFAKKFSLLSIDLHTGRTHQIRVHLSSIRHPILGDEVYGYHANFCAQIQAKHPFLHARRLVFTHPIIDQELNISAPIPPAFQDMLQTLRSLKERSNNGRKKYKKQNVDKNRIGQTRKPKSTTTIK